MPLWLGGFLPKRPGATTAFGDGYISIGAIRPLVTNASRRCGAGEILIA
jgi:hypothetical protein